MKNLYLFLFFFLINFALLAQNGGEIKGTVKDAVTGETVVGASVMVAEGKVAVTDINGNYSIAVDSGSYTVTISYVGFEPQKQKIKVGNKPVTLNLSLATKTLNEIEVTADVAKIRETPVAFSTITIKQIKEELGTRDLPMILNSTPGVYATEQGGGSGDARVSIRGFDQRNVAVMVDGVPVNDMENGQVYWSNWDGLGDITQSMQVQRGLGASKLAIASVGGTINIITKGIDNKFGVAIKQEVNNYGLYKTSFGFNSGQLKDGWGITLAGSRKWGNGYADATFTDAWSYFFKIQKRFKKHLFSLSANGAPQSHGQRNLKLGVPFYSEKLAKSLGINADSVYQYSGVSPFQYYTTATQGERGIKYNPNWGELNGKPFNERVNYFHKPQFNFTHFWTPNEKLYVSTVLYMSIGKGGGTGIKGSVDRDSTTGQLNFQQAYDLNTTSAYNPAYSSNEHPSNVYLRSSNNDHVWYGLISSWNYKISPSISSLIGVDARYYKGSHYQSVYDLIGGDYAIDNSDKNVPGGAPYGKKYVGDKVSYNNDAIVMWGGAFGQVEYKKNKWTTFLTGTVSETGYQRIDHFRKKDLVLPDTLIPQVLGYGNTYTYNGVTYTPESPEAKTSTTPRKWFLGYTIKGGANYNINDHQNAFINLGYLNMAPRMNVVFDNNNKAFLNPKNQKVYAIEAGYGFHNQKFAANLNLYYTLWKNKPPSYTPTVPDLVNGGVLSYNINGLDALHKGVEVDFIYKLLKNLDVQGILSIGDWKTISGEKVYVTNEDGIVQDSVDFSAKNVHVGDAAQIQVGGSIRYEIIKNLYIKPRYTYFGKNYANFDPILLTGENKDRESWKMPGYGLLDIHAGYEFNYWKLKFSLSAGVVNVFNATYITDAQNGIKFDATTATVFVGMGRRYNVGLLIAF
ncbi:MAG: TonB-dependent receptor [Bacteroidota bacterium]|nr:TonB-dependent receptor [Bacteroidota bacterium]